MDSLNTFNSLLNHFENCLNTEDEIENFIINLQNFKFFISVSSILRCFGNYIIIFNLHYFH